MNTFSLIQDLEKGKDKKVDPEISRIRYRQFEMKIDGDATTVNIPIRESVGFADFLDDNGSVNFSSDDARKILRHFRGTKVREEIE